MGTCREDILIMNVTLKIRRFDADSDNPESYWEEFTTDVADNATVLDALIQVREDQDGTLSLRCSCRSAICGSCAMRINGHGGLACKTPAVDALIDGVITCEPAGNMPVIKDLVTNFDVFWDKINQVTPYLQPQGPEPEGEYIASNESMLHLSGVTACIMCGSCVSDCTVLEVDPTFLGPAALAKAYRFTADPRDGDEDGLSLDRLKGLGQKSGMWDCTRCMSCVTACPKGVDPMDRIMALREQAMDAGLTNNNGARHAEAFVELVGHSGSLDELKLPVKTVGMFNIPALLSYVPVGIRSLRRGKLPSLFHKKIEGVENVRRLVKKLEK
ncbi:MAG: succinate dehydrogenase iron-sulfur subunit [SAR202 cluster bacterium]|nr:succinate dehydrogenase iron-sulfur subunit [SAR202 cluster bacterium]